MPNTKITRYICTECGYTELHQSLFSRELKDVKHKTSAGYPCKGSKSLQQYSLGHEFKTDVILIKIKFPFDLEGNQTAAAWTILYALLEGLSHCLNIDRNELSGCLQWYTDAETPDGNYGFVLFDNTPGGAGYVRQLENPKLFAQMLWEAYQVVAHCECGGEKKDTVCYSCLCNYYNQKQHEIMKRRYAIDFFETLLSGGNEFDILPVEKETVTEIPESAESGSLNAELCNQGSLLKVSELWKELLEDCEDEEQDTAVIKNLQQLTENLILPMARYDEYFILPELSGDKYMASAIWPEKKVMLFLSADAEEYQKAVQSRFQCFSTADENFDSIRFIKAIGGM